MTPEVAKAALIFLSRTDLKGAEVQAFVQVCQVLETLANPAPMPDNPITVDHVAS